MSASPGRGLLLRVTSADSTGRWQELLPNAAPQSLGFTASDFVWLNDTAYAAIRTAFESGTALVCQIVYPGAGYYQGAFVVIQLDESAPFDKEISSTLSLESSGVPVWTTGAPA